MSLYKDFHTFFTVFDILCPDFHFHSYVFAHHNEIFTHFHGCPCSSY